MNSIFLRSNNITTQINLHGSVYISIESPPVIFILKKRYHNRNFRTEFLSGKLPRP